MNPILYFGIGALATFIGAIPLGTVNLSVINTTLQQDARNAMKIALAAGVAEILLTFFALHCSAAFTKFIDMHQWIQISIALILMMAGALLFFKKQKTTETTAKRRLSSKFGTGFFLGLLNPPVVIYWILAIGYIDMNATSLNMHSPLAILFVFFAGVYVGKVFTLYLYSKLSNVIKHRVQNIAQRINKIMGVLLLGIGVLQLGKVFIS